MTKMNQYFHTDFFNCSNVPLDDCTISGQTKTLGFPFPSKPLKGHAFLGFGKLKTLGFSKPFVLSGIIQSLWNLLKLSSSASNRPGSLSTTQASWTTMNFYTFLNPVLAWGNILNQLCMYAWRSSNKRWWLWIFQFEVPGHPCPLIPEIGEVISWDCGLCLWYTGGVATAELYQFRPLKMPKIPNAGLDYLINFEEFSFPEYI